MAMRDGGVRAHRRALGDVDRPWATGLDRLLGRRCRAVREPRGTVAYHGRCDLRARHDGLHALERGFVVALWSTDFVDAADRYAPWP